MLNWPVLCGVMGVTVMMVLLWFLARRDGDSENGKASAPSTPDDNVPYAQLVNDERIRAEPPKRTRDKT